MTQRESILGFAEESMKLQEVPVPEWGCSVWMRGWSGTDRDAVEREYSETDKTGLRERVLVNVLFLLNLLL